MHQTNPKIWIFAIREIIFFIYKHRNPKLFKIIVGQEGVLRTKQTINY